MPGGTTTEPDPTPANPRPIVLGGSISCFSLLEQPRKRSTGLITRSRAPDTGLITPARRKRVPFQRFLQPAVAVAGVFEHALLFFRYHRQRGLDGVGRGVERTGDVDYGRRLPDTTFLL